MADREPRPAVSVIVPTYNRRETLARCLDSLARQAPVTLEAVIVDDGSSDDTAAFLAALRPPFALRCLRQDNRGCAAARNAGIAAARGDTLLFLDSDDELAAGALPALLAELQCSGADFVYSPAVEVYAAGNETLNPPVAAGTPERFAVAHFLDPNTRNGAVLFRRPLVERVGGLDETLRHNEDSDFLQRCALAGRAAYCGHPSVRVHHHASNKSRDRVRIYRALLASSARVLATHPEFRARLGVLAERRLAEIRLLLLESLLLAGNHDEARALASELPRLPLAHRLALAAGTPRPLAAALSLRRIGGGLRRRLFDRA